MKPLEGVRVLDLGQIVAGPLSAFYLASLGADVIRVDRPDGDWGWRIAPFVGPDGVPRSERGAGGLSLNHLRRGRGKRNVTLDLKSEAGQVAARQLADEADVVVENQRRGALERLGLGWDDLSARNPRLIWCSIKGYGRGDPRERQQAIDITVQAQAGMMHRTGEAEGPPMRTAVTVADQSAAIHGAFGVMAALAERERTGRGCRVEVSLVDTLIGMLWDDPLDLFATQGLPMRTGNRDVRGAPFDIYRTTDGWVAIVASTDAHWQRLCMLIGAPQLADRFHSPAERAAERDTVDEAITRWSQGVSTAEAEQALAENAIAGGAVLDPLEAVARSDAVARGLMERLTAAGDDPRPSPFLGPRLPITFDGEFTTPPPAEALGASTATVITEDGAHWPA